MNGVNQCFNSFQSSSSSSLFFRFALFFYIYQGMVCFFSFLQFCSSMASPTITYNSTIHISMRRSIKIRKIAAQFRRRQKWNERKKIIFTMKHHGKALVDWINFVSFPCATDFYFFRSLTGWRYCISHGNDLIVSFNEIMVFLVTMVVVIVARKTIFNRKSFNRITSIF